mmetsp:Transcript_15310/g.30102  ORF Transcript_15310/g.30102 Transcript_15310/m.30102 type:complete len:350 (+) Transcript_15310:70-1119(+)|eukprot:CAMPEP_0172715538 /NCGR_PEP_ID=MMETSP1074-20121228/67604_1 /TAXON_ID=2916 /ORGANISM="Ceratium fusus, Strain PA161109" /LENGTH=349 /DNA_ID=CAMNT_0013540123 /DNA_START=61 /DNA_END=1110 /DNA_ORIENTATION=-
MLPIFAVAISLAFCFCPGFGNPCSDLETADDFAASFNLSGKVAIVTGGDSGLGFATAEALARQGAAVVIGGHNVEKCEAAARNLSATTGADVRSSPLDLSSFANVRAFADKFLKDFHGKLHLLINDAGISHETVSGGKTEDGFEQVFQVNYLGHFLLTELLLPALRKSRPSRIVHVASEAHKMACAQAGFSAKWNPFPRCARDFTYIPPPVMTKPNTSLYGFSKLMMIEHAAELSAREAKSGVSAYSLCPGLVVTDMTQANPDIFKMCNSSLSSWIQKPCPYNPQQGAAVITYTALGDALPGLWYQRRFGCKAGTVERSGFTDAMRSELYSRSQKMVGVQSSQSAEIVV